MDLVVPQDEYFEWEDIMAYQTSLEDKDENNMLQSEPLVSCIWKTESVGACEMSNVQRKGTGVANSRSLYSIRTSLSLDTGILETRSSPISFPSYAEFGDKSSTFLIENFAVEAENYEEVPKMMDDIAICPDPLRHVDYLSHDWREEDIWATWKRLASKRKAHKTAERLENASWRAWAKVRLNLKTVDPETLNWMKDFDDTWLYGPFHGNVSSTTTLVTDYSNHSDSSRATLTVQKTRSILKRPRLSEILLRGSDYIKASSSKSVEIESGPFFGNVVKKRVGFREEVEQYAAVQKACKDNSDCQGELDQCTETYQSKFDYGEIYDDPVGDLISTTQSLRQHVQQNITILENYRQQKTVEKFARASLNYPKDSSDSYFSGDDRGKITNSPTRSCSESLQFSALSEWTLLGKGFDEEEDWIEPAPYSSWKPHTESDITFRIPNESNPGSLCKEQLGNDQINIGDQMNEELAEIIQCEGLSLDPSSSDTSEGRSRGSEDVERDDLAYVSVRNFPEEKKSEVQEIRRARAFHQMKQAFVDRVMEDFYISSKEDGPQDFNSLIPPDLIHPALKAA